MILRCAIRLKRILNRSPASARTYCRPSTVSSSSREQPDERLRILFCGSDEFSAFSLRSLSEYAKSPESNVGSIDVVTRKDKRAGRGLKSIRSPFIKSVAEELQLPLHQIDTFTGWTPPSYGQSHESPATINLIIAVSFGLLVPPRILRGAAYGGFNVHPSLLPRFKGAAPIQWTILHGLATTGVSLQTLHASKFDEGVVLNRTPVPVRNSQTCTFNQLRDQLGPVGAELLIKCLREKRYLSQGSVLKDLVSERTSYAPKIKKQHAAIDPQLHGSRQILRMQRAFETLWAYAHDLDGNIVRVLSSSMIADGLSLPEHSSLIPECVRPTAASVPIGVPYGIISGGRQPTQAGEAPLFLNTIDGLLAIKRLTVGGAPAGSALTASAKGRLLEHHVHMESSSGQIWDVYKFCAPLGGEIDGLPTIVPAAD
jgi:methionyl-tRNA formyltransferase